jgi:DNA gyrase/topoisomerase IV subunit A
MITPEKIEEWIREAEERPGSATVLLQYIANRVRDLTARNEELRAENLALRTEKRVEEYQQRIANLEYQLDLLRRQLGGDLPAGVISARAEANQTAVSLLLYDSQGRILRSALGPANLADGAELARLAGERSADGDEQPRLMVVPSFEELLFVFSSGRIATLAVESIPASSPLDWSKAQSPQEARGGETLACLAPISRMAMAEFMLQASRRGYVKKLMTSLSSSILNKHYIGTGAVIPGDRTHTLLLGGKDDRLVLVSREGYLLTLDVRDLPFSPEEAFRLGPTDLISSMFTAGGGRSILVMTQLGKLVHWTEDRLETVHALKSKGQALFSAQRRERGTRVVGAAAVREEDWGVALHRDGRITAHSVRSMVENGAIAGEDLVDFTAFGLTMGKPDK